MQPLLKPGVAYLTPKAFKYEILNPSDTRYSAVPFSGKPPSPPPSENAEPPSEPVDKAEEGTQDGGKGGEPAASNEVTPESTGLPFFAAIQVNFC